MMQVHDAKVGWVNPAPDSPTPPLVLVKLYGYHDAVLGHLQYPRLNE